MVNVYIKKVAAAVFILGLLTSCSGGALTAEELAARETESDASLWDEEDYKSIAAKACLKFNVVFKNALGEWYADWDKLGTEYTIVGLTSGALDDHPKWDPIARTVRQMTTNALSRALGGGGVEVWTAPWEKVLNLCDEIGVDLTE